MEGVERIFRSWDLGADGWVTVANESWTTLKKLK
jgi:hypothetical protein